MIFHILSAKSSQYINFPFICPFTICKLYKYIACTLSRSYTLSSSCFFGSAKNITRIILRLRGTGKIKWNPCILYKTMHSYSFFIFNIYFIIFKLNETGCVGLVFWFSFRKNCNIADVRRSCCMPCFVAELRDKSTLTFCLLS